MLVSLRVLYFMIVPSDRKFNEKRLFKLISLCYNRSKKKAEKKESKHWNRSREETVGESFS